MSAAEKFEEEFGGLTPEALAVLQIRQANAKTSVAKFAKMLEIADEDDRVRYILQYAGAGRTWRWGGRTVQPQNMARPSLTVRSIEIARELVRDYDIDMLDLLFDASIMEILSSIARSMFAAPEGKKLVVCDYAAIENVVLGYCAGAESILSIFEEGLDPYKSFGVPLLGKKYDDITKAERTFCKPPVLGCGFMLGGPGLKRYADSMGVAMTDDEAERAKSLWRDTYHEVPTFWYALSDAVMNVIRDKKPREIGPIRLAYEKPMLRIYLPSGRALSYVRPRIEQKRKPWVDENTGKPAIGPTIVYDGVHQNTKQWVALTTHPGKLTENVVQAIARDLLAQGLKNADAMNFEIVGHVHDEIIALVSTYGALGLPQLKEAMLDVPTWATHLPIQAEGYESEFYRKD